ncbi:MAG: hypothetical protein FWE41_02740 [Coriobacteriia bacterium]|nr:hypothetical protein [Coriobacteriia bacterium]MCL2750605.1 hypothetical protein [Coriobacteriia bacterium]
MVPTKKAELQKALQTEKEPRETVFKGFYIYRDQYTRLIELTAQNKIKGVEPSSQSEILRAALDAYLGK